MTNDTYMERCLELAAFAKAKGKTAVGSLIVQNEKIIGEGMEGDMKLPAVMSHAEALAIIAAIEYTGSYDLKGCTLYTTVEPCFMCAYLIRQTKIGTVVYGTATEEVGGDSSVFPVLKMINKKWPEAPLVVSRCLEKECLDMLKKG